MIANYSSIQISTIKMHFNFHTGLDLCFKLINGSLISYASFIMRYLGNSCHFSAVMRLI